MLKKGDTIIEVMLAITVFSLVAIGAYVIMNRSSNSLQTSLEVTLVRQQMDAQVEMLRMIYSQARDAEVPAAINNWQNIVTGASTLSVSVPSLPDLIEDDTRCVSPPTSRRFIIHPDTGVAISNANAIFKRADETTPASRDMVPYASVSVAAGNSTIAHANGIWIQVVRGGSSIPGQPDYPQYYDFHVRACWNSAGDSTMPMTLGTITRIYDATR